MIAIVPAPRQLDRGEGALLLTESARIVATDPRLEPLASVLLEELRAATGRTLALAQDAARSGDVVLQFGGDERVPESYRLAVDQDVVITAPTCEGVARGTTTLLQAIPGKGEGLAVPRLRVEDAPQTDFRAVFIDVARRPHSLSDLRDVIRLCRLYKIRFLQLHLTDDEAWTFPSRAFPALGSDNQRGIPCYGPGELRELVAFADARGVTLVPEIDLPGHCGALLRVHPEIFDGAAAGNVNVATENVYQALGTLMEEVADLFPSSPYLHFGADEVTEFERVFEHNQEDPYIRGRGIRNASQLFTHFMERMVEFIESHGKQAMAWEGHRAATEILRRILMVAWENESYPLPDLLRDGYQVVNAPWCPLYLLENETDVTPRFLHERWNPRTYGRYLSKPRTTEQCELHELPPHPSLRGAMLCSWENRGAFEVPGLRRLLPVLAEKLWSGSGSQGFAQLEARVQHTDRLLDRLRVGRR